MMRTHTKILLGFGLAAAIAGCADSTGPAPAVPPAVTNSAAGANYGREEATLQHVARAIALALRQNDVRLALRDAMRDSPWDVHQISLQEYLDSRAGRGLLVAAAGAAGETPEAFRARLAGFPDLDFYVPSRDQRRTWKGTPGVSVAASLNAEGGKVFGFNPSGQGVANVLRSGDGNGPVVLIHPAEPRGRRNVVERTAGDVIQSPREVEEASSFTWTGADGRETKVSLAAVRSGNEPRFTTATSTYGDSTYIDYIRINFEDPGDDAELIVTAKFYGPDGAFVGQGEYSNYSIRWHEDYYLHVPILRPVLPDQSVARIEVKVREDDCGCFGNNDDHFGPRDYTWVDRGQIRQIGGSAHVDLELDWVARRPSVFTRVEVYPTSVYLGSSTYAAARAVDQYGFGLPGYSVSAWSSANPAIASVNASGLVYGNALGSTTLYATINGVTGNGPVYVEEYIPPPTCDPYDPYCIQ